MLPVTLAVGWLSSADKVADCDTVWKAPVAHFAFAGHWSSSGEGPTMRKFQLDPGCNCALRACHCGKHCRCSAAPMMHYLPYSLLRCSAVATLYTAP